MADDGSFRQVRPTASCLKRQAPGGFAAKAVREALVADQPDHPMALAMQWVARVFAATLMMCLPGIGGQWLDGAWGTRLFGPAGFVLGLIGGVVYLIAVTRAADKARRAKSGDSPTPRK